MEEKSFDVSGGIVFWTLGNTDRIRLVDQLTAIGLGEYAPKERTPKAILKDALTQLFADAKNLVRPLMDKAAFTVVKEDRGELENQYETVLTATVDPDNGVLTVSPSSYAMDVRKAYNSAADVLPPISVATAMVDIVDHLSGIALRPAGGFYWLPRNAIKKWKVVAEAVQSSAVSKNGSWMGLVLTPMDADSLATMQHAIVDSITEQVAKLSEEISSNKLGHIALESRQAQATALRRRLKEYETLLGKFSADVHDRLEKVEIAAVNACMQAALDASNKAAA